MGGSTLFNLYSRLPVWLQNVACSAAGLKMRKDRYNRTFKETLAFLEDSQWWPEEQLKAYQDEQLRSMIVHAYRSVPYYRELFDSQGLMPADIQSSEDLVKLPILTKQTLRGNWEALQSTEVPASRRRYGNTGGTTGTAVKVAYDQDTQPWQWAVWWRHRHRFRIDIDDSFIVFAGRDVVPMGDLKPPIWRRNVGMRQTYVSIHHLSKENLPVLSDYLCRRKVKYYSGYPSALYTVACYFNDYGIKLPYPPSIVFTGAETLLPHQRRAIEEAFSAIVSDQYGASEHCGNISECELHRYHVDMEFGVVELLPIHGMPDNVRRIICTGLRNHAMPFIRYETGDIATVSSEQCPCGRKSPVVDKIDGRIESYILTPDGRQLGRLDFLFKKSTNIEEAQLVQEELSRVRFRIVKNSSYTEQDEKHLIEDVHRYMGTSFQIDLEYIDSIPRETNGKFRQIVSSVFRERMTSLSDIDQA